MKCANCTNEARTVYFSPGVVPIFYCNAHTPPGLPVRLVDPPLRPGLEPPANLHPPGEEDIDDEISGPTEPAVDLRPGIPTTVKAILEWVGDDPVRAEIALNDEEKNAHPRKTLISGLSGLIS